MITRTDAKWVPIHLGVVQTVIDVRYGRRDANGRRIKVCVNRTGRTVDPWNPVPLLGQLGRLRGRSEF
jgi:hypothetical protein